jgi:tRNA_anti-like
MSSFARVLGMAGVFAAAAWASGQDPAPAVLGVTAGQLLNAVSTNEAALDRQLAASSIEVRGIAKKIFKTETGDYVLQFLPDNTSDNFVRLEINFEFPKAERDQLGSLNLPAELTIRGTMKQSVWAPRYDNHRYYKMVIKDSQILANVPVWDLR